MTDETQGKIVWVIGASSGIGEAIAHKFYNESYRVILSARRESRLESLRDQLLLESKPQADASVLPVDVTQVENAEQTVAAALAVYGRVDVVVFSSGVSNRGSVLNTSMDVHREVMEINYFGVVALARVLLRSFVERKQGSFIVVSSVQGKFGIPNRSPYAASKHALHGFFECLRYEGDKDNVKVLLVCPGYVKTELSLNALTEDGSKHSTMDETTASGFTPAYVAEQTYHAFVGGKEEVVIAQAKVNLAIALKAYMPSLLSRILKRRAKKES